MKKSPSAGSAAATASSSSSSSQSANKKEFSDDEDDDDEDDEDDEVDGLRLPRQGPMSRESRASSGRSGGDELNASVHSVIGGGNRQTTPLPPEPLGQVQQPGGPGHPQQQQHFSGDSQDSSKGYTSITVREPVRHIHLPPVRGRGDATYATLSETSDEMYAAIEDPTYIPTGTSQSNSDTYAVIDLPPEEVYGARGAVAAVSMNPGQNSYMHHTYSKVDKSKKSVKAQPLPPPPPPPPPPPTTDRRLTSKLEDMYAKIQKRLPSPLSPGEQELLDGMPIGASAITQSREALQGPDPAPSGGGGDSARRLGAGARPKVRSAEWGPSAVASDNPRRQLKSEINYSDYEVSLYDNHDKRQQQQQQQQLHHRPRQESLNEAGYETLPDPATPMHPQSSAKTSDPGYETVPDVLRQTIGWKRSAGGGGGTGYDSADAGYETVPSVARGAREDNQQPDDDYWKSNASSGGGYETLPESRVGGGGGGKGDPGYEELSNRNGNAADGYASWGRKRRDPGYETVGPAKRINSGGATTVAAAAVEKDNLDRKVAKEPPYAKIQGSHAENDVDSEVGYETIPGGGGARHRGNSEYDPGYEELVTMPPPPPKNGGDAPPLVPAVPATEDGERFQGENSSRNFVAGEEGAEIELDESVDSAAGHGGPSSSLIHMSVQQSVTDVPDTPGFHRRSSLVVIEHVADASGVSDVDAAPHDEGSSTASDKNVHIFV